MMSDRELFKAALADGICERYESELAQLNGSALVISPEHINALNKIMRPKNDRSKWKKAIAAILIAALLALVGCAVAYREEIFGFIMQLEDGYFSFRGDGAEQTDFVPCYLAYVPEGYEITKEIVDEDYSVIYQFENSDGEIIKYSQSPLSSTQVSIDNIDGTTRYLHIDGFDIYVRDFEEIHTYLFTDGKNVFKISDTFGFSEEELTRIITGITPK